MHDEFQTQRSKTTKCPHCKSEIILEGLWEIWQASGDNDYDDWSVTCESCGNSLNLTFIDRESRLQPKSEPSTEESVPWLSAERKVGAYPQPTERAGKSLIFMGAAVVDDVWRKIKQAVEDGKLGGVAKVSTAMPNPNSRNSSTHVICVYTYDADDEADVERVRSSLRDLGLTSKIPYKSDAATIEGKYAKSGDNHVSGRYE
jgi:hypothetical protein